MPLPSWVPFVLIGLAVVSAIGFAVYYFRDDDDEDDDESDGAGAQTLMLGGDTVREDSPLGRTTEEYQARKSRMVSLSTAVEDSLRTREGVAAYSKNRFTQPWFLLVGATDSGKSTLLANTGLPLPFGPPIEVDATHRDAGRWWLFEDAVMLEAPPPIPDPMAASTLAPGQAAPSAGWNTLLHMLRRERPDSPLNGIVITIAAADLVGARSTPELVQEQADQIRGFLDRARIILGVRLPVHVLVTKCDVLPGFRSFAEALPDVRRDEIFGWANSHGLERPFDPAWIDEGFKTLRGTLSELYDQVLAAPDEVTDADGLFVFLHEFADLHEPLRDYVSRLIPPGQRRPPLFFRGMYFSGDMIEQAPAGSHEDIAAAGTLRMSAEVALAESGEHEDVHRLVFLKKLFSAKIFKEGGLARSATRIRFARDRRVVAAQAAAMLIAFGGGAGLWTTLYGYRQDDRVIHAGLHADAEQLARVLTGVAIDMDEAANPVPSPTPDTALARRTRDAAVIELVDEMRHVTPIHKSAFIPSSWFSSVPGGIRRSMSTSIQTVVLPVSRARLQERVKRLLSPAFASDSLHGLDIADPRALTSYLDAWQELSANIARYNALARPGTGDAEDLSGLMQYLYDQSPFADSAEVSPDFVDALRGAQAPTLGVTADMANSVMRRSVAMIRVIAEAASRQLAPRATPQAERAVNPQDDLLALRRVAALVDLTDAKHGLVASVTDSGMFGVGLAHAIQDSIDAQLQLIATRIARDSLAPEPAAERLKRVITVLFEYRFMEPVEGRSVSNELRANQRMRFDLGRLELALALRGEYVQGLVTVGEAFPGQVPDRIKRALETQLRDRVIDVAASSERFLNDSLAVDDTVEVQLAAANLDGVASRINRLAGVLDTMNARDEGTHLHVAAQRQAERVMAIAQREYDRQNYFAPHTDAIARWQGVLPFSFAYMNVGDSLALSTSLYRPQAAITTLAHNVAPAVSYLKAYGSDSVRAVRLLATWDAVVSAVQKFDRGDPTSSAAVLRSYLRQTLGVTDLAGCAAIAAQPDSVKSAVDLFEVRRREARASASGRCVPGGSASGVRTYRAMRALFESRLAGRFPFVDSVNVLGAPDADPAAIRELFRLYDGFRRAGDVELRSDPRLVDPAKNAIAFLDQLAKVRPFVAAFVDSGTVHRLPEYALLIGAGEDVREEPWRYGDSVIVGFASTDSGDEPVFTPGGGWSPLKYVMRHGQMPVRFFHPDTKLELAVPVFPSSAPEIIMGGPARPAAAATGVTGTKTATPTTGTKTVAPAPGTKTAPSTKAPMASKTPPRATKAPARRRGRP
jgi:type VI secretion system protein ImpL